MYNFRQQLRHSLAPDAQSSSDGQMIRKLYLNFAFNALQKAHELVFCGLLIKIGGGLWVNSFPMMQLFVIQHSYRLARDFYREVDKFVKFRAFLKNIDGNYPLVEFPENEECAICKEGMSQARRLPCGHSFHWFCIVQLIESGSKNCPICRSEFNRAIP